MMINIKKRGNNGEKEGTWVGEGNIGKMGKVYYKMEPYHLWRGGGILFLREYGKL